MGNVQQIVLRKKRERERMQTNQLLYLEHFYLTKIITQSVKWEVILKNSLFFKCQLGLILNAWLYFKCYIHRHLWQQRQIFVPFKNLSSNCWADTFSGNLIPAPQVTKGVKVSEGCPAPWEPTAHRHQESSDDNAKQSLNAVL